MAWKRSTVRTRPGPPILSIIPAHRFGQPAFLDLPHRLLATRNIEQHVTHRGLRLRGRLEPLLRTRSRRYGPVADVNTPDGGQV